MNFLMSLLVSCNILYLRSAAVVERFFATSPNCSGMFKVDDIHEIYWEESGNPNGIPVFVLHGGPGVGSQEKDHSFLDPKFYRIIMFDQRGCGKSTPNKCLTNNTTWDLVEDINKLRVFLNIERCVLFGNSWGTTLALSYAIKHPENVSGMLLRGLYLARQSEIDWLYKNGANHQSPEAWEFFTSKVPQEKQSNLMVAYNDLLKSESLSIQNDAAASWVLWEFANAQAVPDHRLATLLNSPFVFQIFANSYADFNKTLATIELHYSLNKCFFETDNWILENIHRIQNIPGIIVQGKLDSICPWETAQELHQNWPSSTFMLLPNVGHSSHEPGTPEAMTAASELLKTKIT